MNEIKIIIEYRGVKNTIEFPSDSGCGELMKQIALMMVSIGYDPITVIASMEDYIREFDSMAKGWKDQIDG
jgi:hypothetical protein